MSFKVSVDDYDRFMGRYSRALAPGFVEFAGVEVGWRVLDVGCGSGTLTAELARRLEASSVWAVDPQEQFVAAVRSRLPGVRAQIAASEALPFEDRLFDAALAQLVVHFMADPVAGLREMARVVRRGGVVAACVWDQASRMGPLSLFWDAARELDPDVEDESRLAGTREGHLAELLEAAGLRELQSTSLAVQFEHATFEEWWEPFTLGVGPAGGYVSQLDSPRRARLRDACRARLPMGGIVIPGRAWAALGRV
jgi:ubiquinone/menaquinone biosynthesis C-methylase UbiE